MSGNNGKAWMQKLTGNRIAFGLTSTGISFFWKKQIVKVLFNLRNRENNLPRITKFS